LLSCVGVVCDVGKVIDFRWMNFFVFAGDKHGSHTEKLVFLPFDLDLFSVSIDQVNGDK
jgi:hypothetical protein